MSRGLNLLLHASTHEHVRFLKVSHYGSLIHHILLVLLIDQAHKVVSKTTHATDHVLLLHPAWIHRSSLRFSLSPTFENSGVLIVCLATSAVMLGGEASAPIPAAAVVVALALAVWVMLQVGMLA